MRARSVVALALVLGACGGRAEPSPTPPAPRVDRTPAERPAETLLELALEGGDATLASLIAQLPPVPMRAGIPFRVSALLDGLIETPPEIRSRVSTTSSLRLLMARIDGETRSAVAVELDGALPAIAHAGDGPRGSHRIGDRSAVDARVAVVSDDPAMLDLAFAYLAYSPPAATHDTIELRVPAATLSTTLRAALERAVRDQRARATASIAAARAAHDRPPDLGDPEALVALFADLALARIAYLPDLGDATIVLRATPSGIALRASASVTEPSPLAAALADHVAIDRSFVSAMPSSSALVVATGTTRRARTAARGELVDALASIAGSRLGATEHAALDDVSRTLSALSGETTAFAIGASETSGAFAITLTRGATEDAAPTPWGRTFPWTTSLLAALVGCAPVQPRVRASGVTICGDIALVTRTGDDVRADAIGHEASALADAARIRLVDHTPAASPDLARDLGALDGSLLAIAVVRPLHALPLLALLDGAPHAGLPHGDGAIVIAAAHEEHRLELDLRASAAALADLAALGDLFSESAGE